MRQNQINHKPGSEQDYGREEYVWKIFVLIRLWEVVHEVDPAFPSANLKHCVEALEVVIESGNAVQNQLIFAHIVVFERR